VHPTGWAKTAPHQKPAFKLDLQRPNKSKNLDQLGGKHLSWQQHLYIDRF